MTGRIRVETDERGCRTIWLDRPAKRNALDEPFLVELLAAARATDEDAGVRLLLVRSTSAVFCAGADLNVFAHIGPPDAQRLTMLGHRAFQALADCRHPVVAVLDGPALGGGLELALACDIRLGTEAARLGFPEPRLANSPGWGGMARLVAIAGPAVARDMLLTGDVVSGADAHRSGLLQRYCQTVDLSVVLSRLVDSILACEAGTLSYLKAVLGSPSQALAAQDAVVAGFTAGSPASRERKDDFLSRR